MASRRDFLSKSLMASAGIAVSPLAAFAGIQGARDVISGQESATSVRKKPFRLPAKFGMGGVAAGDGWHVNTNKQIDGALEAAWQAGVRYYDTSPFYGYGLSERRFGHFLYEKERKDFILSSKVGRVFEAAPDAPTDPATLWQGKYNFRYHFDYTAQGVRRSVEDTLERLGLPYLDIVYVHDLSPDTGDIGNWQAQFKIATEGAFPELTRMREEGLIKAWGLGVNTPQPILQAMQVADPDIMVVAIQYTLVYHQETLHQLFPEMEKHHVKAVIGGPLNGGFLAGRDRWNYDMSGKIPPEMLAKREKINAIIAKYGVDLRTVALQFSAAHPVVAAVIPGASTAAQAAANVKSFEVKIPDALWQELKKAGLIDPGAPVPVS